jgi:hypothetical protein
VVRHLRHGEITTAKVHFVDQKIRGRNRDASDLEPAYEKPREQAFTIRALNIDRADLFSNPGSLALVASLLGYQFTAQSGLRLRYHWTFYAHRHESNRYRTCRSGMDRRLNTVQATQSQVIARSSW